MKERYFFLTSFVATLFFAAVASVTSLLWGHEALFFSLGLIPILSFPIFVSPARPLRNFFWGLSAGLWTFAFLVLPLIGNLWPLVVGTLTIGITFLRRPKWQLPSFTIRAFPTLLGWTSFLFAWNLALHLQQLYGNFLYHFVFSIVVFFFGMGIGHNVSQKRKSTLLPLLPLLIFLKALLGAASLFAVREVASHHDTIATLISHFFYLALLGFLTGTELFLLPLSPSAKTSDRSPLVGFESSENSQVTTDWQVSYLSGGATGALSSFAFFAFLAPSQTALILSAITLATLLYISARTQKRGPVKVGVFLILSALIIRFVYSIPTLRSELFDQKYFSISDNSQLALSIHRGSQSVVSIITPALDIEPEKGSIPEFDNAIKLISGSQPHEEWISFFHNGNLKYFSPLAANTDFFHHSAVHPAVLTASDKKNVLILGGGTGLLAKELLKYPSFQKITIVENNSILTTATRTQSLLRHHTLDALNHEKVQIIPANPFSWVSQNEAKFDVVIIDSVDEDHFPFLRQYTFEFLKNAKHLLHLGSSLSLSAPPFGSAAFWNLVRTAIALGYHVAPHHSLDPSGHDGFLLLSLAKKDFSKYQEQMSQFPFVISEILLNSEVMQEYANPQFFDLKSQDYSINSVLHPSFFRFYPGAMTWFFPDANE